MNTRWLGMAVGLSLLVASLLVVGRLASPVAAQAQQPGEIAIVDTHVHLWSIERRAGTAWIAPDRKTLKRDFLPKHHEPIAAASGVAAVVVVQAGHDLPDNEWNLEITSRNPQLYRGVVGNLSKIIGTDEFQPRFQALCRDGRYRGYRLSNRYQEVLTDAFYRDLAATAAAGRTLDVLVGEYRLEDVAQFAARVPKLKIIIDHFGNLRLDGSPLSPEWVKTFQAVAKFPSVYCKVSALYGRVLKQPAPREIEFYRPILDLAWETFGEDRLIYGSDWPVSETTGDYASVLKLTRTYFDPKGPAVCEKVFHANAVRFYGLDDAGKP